MTDELTRRFGNDRARFGLAAVLLIVGPFAALTAIVLITAPGVPGVDAALASSLHRLVLPRPGLARALRVIGVISLPWCLRAPALVAALVLWWRGRGRAALWLVLTLALGGTASVLLKVIFSRDRPPWADPVAVASGYSYPSGHALNSMLVAGCLIALLRPGFRGSAGGGASPPAEQHVHRSTEHSSSGSAERTPWGRADLPRGRADLPQDRADLARAGVWALTGAVVVLIGFDRVALGVHYLTDVLAGWTIGLAVVLLALAIADPRPLGPPESRPPAGIRRSAPAAGGPGPAETWSP